MNVEKSFKSIPCFHDYFVSKNDDFKILLSPWTENLKGIQNWILGESVPVVFLVLLFLFSFCFLVFETQCYDRMMPSW